LTENQAPETLEEWYEKGNQYFNKFQYEKAIECYDKVLAKIPHHVKAQYKKGESFEKLNQFHKAVGCYHYTAIFAWGKTTQWYNENNTKFNNKMFELICKSCDNIITMESNNAIAWFVKSKALAKLEQTIESEKCYSKSIELGIDVKLKEHPFNETLKKFFKYNDDFEC